MRSLHTAMKSNLHSPQLEKALKQQWRPSKQKQIMFFKFILETRVEAMESDEPIQRGKSKDKAWEQRKGRRDSSNREGKITPQKQEVNQKKKKNHYKGEGRDNKTWEQRSWAYGVTLSTLSLTSQRIQIFNYK